MTMILILGAAMTALFYGLRASVLSANRQLDRQVDTSRFVYPVAAGKKIYKHANVGLDPAGNCKPFEPGDLWVGLAESSADNSAGAAAAIDCAVLCEGVYVLPLTSVTQADVGKPLYATADDAYALSGHPDAYVGRIYDLGDAANSCLVRLRQFGEKAPNGIGSVELVLTGHEHFPTTGATAGDEHVNGFEIESILGPGISGPTDAENGGITLAFDATAEVALASIRTPNDLAPVDKGITFECELCVTDIADANAVDIDFGLGTALTTNSEADIDHADMAQLACFHLDGASDNILAQSDNATTDVAPVDTTIDNDSTTDVAKKFKVIVRPSGAVEFWINGARVLSSTTFAVLSTAVLAAFVNMEKTSNDTTASLIVRNLRFAYGCAA